MSKIKIAVVEDEIIIADNICDTLESLGYEVLEPAISYSETIELLDDHRPDLVILDIQLSGKKDGIDLAWKIKEDFDIPFIFLTSNADKLTVDRAKKVTPPAYLVKPFNKDELYTSIEIALYNYSKANKELQENIVLKDALFIKQKHLFVKVEFKDILYLKSDHVYIEIFTVNEEKFLVRGSLNDYLENDKLDENFIRIHRSYILNLKHLYAINHSIVKVGSYEIPIGKSYREALMKMIKTS